LVTAFLVNYFRRYLEYDYTATLEGELDDVSAGDKHYKDVLERFWKDFSAAVARPRSCASPTCWKRSTRCWSRTSSRRTRRARTRAFAPIAASGV
jgi:hypothetical protein